MDFPYLAKVTRLNVRVLEHLAAAPLPPAATAKAAVQTFTEVQWAAVPGAASYSVWRRRTDTPYWEDKPVIADVVATSARLDLRGDADAFEVQLELEAREGNELRWARSWHRRIPRHLG